MSQHPDNFDPDNCSREDMNYLADHIENWLKILKKIMVIPKEMEEEFEEPIEESIRRCEKLIKKLRKGDRSIFIEPE